MGVDTVPNPWFGRVVGGSLHGAMVFAGDQGSLDHIGLSPMLWQEQNARRMQILVVDDSVHIHHQLRTYFSAAGYENVSYVLSAAEAFEQIAYNDKRVANSVDLILMDIDPSVA
ncbi:MAG: hypothetical protein AB2807_11795 [Candidatus Sedimenticola endophacoides]